MIIIFFFNRKLRHSLLSTWSPLRGLLFACIDTKHATEDLLPHAPARAHAPRRASYKHKHLRQWRCSALVHLDAQQILMDVLRAHRLGASTLQAPLVVSTSSKSVFCAERVSLGAMLFVLKSKDSGRVLQLAGEVDLYKKNINIIIK